MNYQYVSANTVRIELIPEDRKETALLDGIKASPEDDSIINELFTLPLSNYAPSTKITKITRINFMDFPKVALVTFEKIAVEEKSCA